MATDNPMPTPFMESDFPYFRRLWNQTVIALLAAAFVPLIVIGGSMYHYATSTLKTQTLAALHEQARLHRKAVDQFLAERLLDLKAMAVSQTQAALEQPGRLGALFEALQPNTGQRHFTDLGLIDAHGIHLAYVGPHDLMGKNYVNAPWFRAVMASGQHVSDVFLGLRKQPHFIIAVKRQEGGRSWILRATVDAAGFDERVREIAVGGKGDCFLVNRAGRLQTTPRRAGHLTGTVDINIPDRFEGIRVEETDGKVRLTTWLDQVPWLSVIEMDRNEIFRMMRRVRHVGIFLFILGGVLIGFTVLLTTNHLVGQLETKRQSIQLMAHHLRQANKMTLSLQLTQGFLQEINEALANIDSTAAWISEQAGGSSGENICSDVDVQLEQIRTEIHRGRDTVHELLALGQPTTPIVTDVHVNQTLDRVIALFRRELHFNDIRIHREFQVSLPSVRTDPSLLNQVFENLMFNALEALGKDGVITVKTLVRGDYLHIVVADDGPGMGLDTTGRIFEPLFTTNPRHLGLGLAICRDILDQMGGTLSVATQPGKGAAFTVVLPFRFNPASTP